MKQFIKFCFVGGFSFLIDYLALFVLTEFARLPCEISNCISFSISVIFNYLMSMKFVFKSTNDNKTKDFIIFITLSLIGLGINELLLIFGKNILGIHYMIVKVFATGVVMVFNFVSRKVVYESDRFKKM